MDSIRGDAPGRRTAKVGAFGIGRRWWPWLGALVGAAILGWTLRRLDAARFLASLAGADLGYLGLVPLAIIAEQLVRAWKWRQLLHPIRMVPTSRLFGAIMAGYLTGLLIPFGFATLARSWLVARRENLATASVLATVALDRITDGLIFALLVPIAVVFAVSHDLDGQVRLGLIVAGGVSAVGLALVVFILACYRNSVLDRIAGSGKASSRWRRIRRALHDPARSFASGLTWPRSNRRRLEIIAASIAIKLIAATHFLFAGRALGVTLPFAAYIFLLVFLGFIVILGRFVRIAGGFTIGAIFALGLLDVAQERALAMTLIVQSASLLSVASIGAFALWQQGVDLTDLRDRASA